MKLESYDRVGTLRGKLIDIDKQIVVFTGMVEPSMVREWHNGLLRAEVRHPTDYRAGSVSIELPTDYVQGALKVGRELILSELRELGVQAGPE